MDLLVGAPPRASGLQRSRWGATLPRRVDARAAGRRAPRRSTVEEAEHGRRRCPPAAFEPPPCPGYRARSTRRRRARSGSATLSAGAARLTVPSFAKVNLGLEVLGTRADGYHELRTLFQTIDLARRHRAAAARRGRSRVACDHPVVPAGRDEPRRRAPRERSAASRRSASGVEIAINKRIPVAGGLGGGSSNAAAVLLGLDRLWRLGLGPAGLHRLARRLGADVPFFLVGGTALGLARGDEVYPLRRQVRATSWSWIPERPSRRRPFLRAAWTRV